MATSMASVTFMLEELQKPAHALVHQNIWMVAENLACLLDHRAATVGVVRHVIRIIADLVVHLAAVAANLGSGPLVDLGEVAHRDLGPFNADIEAVVFAV